MGKTNNNKKVLLRERKRHTARRIASVRYAALSGGGVVPHPRSGGTPFQVWGEGIPHLRVGGVPQPGLNGGWGGGFPSQVWGGPHLRVGGYPGQVSMVGGTPSQVQGGTQSQGGGYPRYSLPSRPSQRGVPWVPPSPTIQT